MSDLEGVLGRSKRNFIVVAHRARSDGNIYLNDLCGASGRWDAVARSITAALFLSHDMRRDTSIHILLLGPDDPPKLLSIDGRDVKYLNPDERASAALMKKCLKEHLPKETGSMKRPSPGITITRADLADVLNSIRGPLIFLHEEGGYIEGPSSLPIDEDHITFLLSDDMDLTEEETQRIEGRSDRTVSFGRKVLHTHMAIVVVHYLLDLQDS
jgi:tRNA (pseudouridine54-N1)-methyltransferase